MEDGDRKRRHQVGRVDQAGQARGSDDGRQATTAGWRRWLRADARRAGIAGGIAGDGAGLVGRRRGASPAALRRIRWSGRRRRRRRKRSRHPRGIRGAFLPSRHGVVQLDVGDDDVDGNDDDGRPLEKETTSTTERSPWLAAGTVGPATTTKKKGESGLSLSLFRSSSAWDERGAGGKRESEKSANAVDRRNRETACAVLFLFFLSGWETSADEMLREEEEEEQ
mmetsp:Transcript_1975/g.5203  ORF Transcript_1975/g.5203 Transcript_1975/m.5203 type:complete len:224 (+) Transcript_1975:649-1320(+)